MMAMKVVMWILSVCLVLCLTGCGATEDPADVVVGNHAPTFTLESRDGTTVKSNSLKGDIVILNFWATYCQPCRSEIPELNQVAASAEAKVLGISLDDGGAEVIKAFEKQANLKLNYTVLLGDQEIFQRFNGVGIPYTLVLDRSQRIAAIYRGPVNRESLERDLAKIHQEETWRTSTEPARFAATSSGSATHH
jgi:thiol-disulfide isomerase/thioredoxin